MHMSELLAVVVRGLVAVLGHLAAMLDLAELWEGRRRRRRLSSLARGERADIPCVLQDPELTENQRREGWLGIGGGTRVSWRAKGDTRSTVFDPGPLTMEAVDEKAITFRSPARRTEVRVHPDEAPHVLRALEEG